MSAITSIELFLEHVRTCTAAQDDYPLERCITAWLAYYRCLQFIRERYNQTNIAYLQAIRHYLHTRQGLPSGTHRSTTTAQHAQAEAHALYNQLQEKYASFYTFAAGLLNSIADTFQGYFALAWPRSDITHARLSRDFPSLCTEKGLSVVPATLPTLMRELHVSITAYHPSLTPLIEEHPEERLTALSTAIDVYITAMMHFCARNEAQSVLRSALADHP